MCNIFKDTTAPQQAILESPVVTTCLTSHHLKGRYKGPSLAPFTSTKQKQKPLLSTQSWQEKIKLSLLAVFYSFRFKIVQLMIHILSYARDRPLGAGQKEVLERLMLSLFSGLPLEQQKPQLKLSLAVLATNSWPPSI